MRESKNSGGGIRTHEPLKEQMPHFDKSNILSLSPLTGLGYSAVVLLLQLNLVLILVYLYYPKKNLY